jgi:hypothetical protein
MSVWKRKHVDDLAYAVKRFSRQDEAAAAPHAESLDDIYLRAKRLSACTHSCTDANIGEIVVALCGVCKAAKDYACDGRDNWTQPCELVAEATR